MGASPYLALAALLVLASSLPASAQSVLQYHNSGTRSGLYVDPLFNASSVPMLALDPTFNVTIPGPVYAQTLYLANSSLSGRDVIFVATEQNQVRFGLDRVTPLEVDGALWVYTYLVAAGMGAVLRSIQELLLGLRSLIERALP